MPEGYFTSALAKEMILSGTAPDDLWTDRLVFEGELSEIHLPKRLKVQRLEFKLCEYLRALPEELFAQDVFIYRCPSFETVPERAWASRMSFDTCPALRNLLGRATSIEARACPNLSFIGPFHCENLFMPGCGMEVLPPGVRAKSVMELSRSRWLREIGEQDLSVLNLSGCERLEYLPGYLRAHRLTLTGCTSLKWQDWADVHVGTLELQDCTQIRTVPEWLTAGSIDVANSGLRAMPEHLKGKSITWRGVEVDERIAFRPEAIEAKEVLREENSERRRVMLERVGWERFFAEVKPKIIHRDRDPGGERLLMEFRFENDRETAVVLAVQCPSTGRKYFIRVPPERETCHAAAAWIAGFDDEEEYEPVVET
jgi:hypothetical protein